MITITSELVALREMQERMRSLVDAAFPAGSRVWPVGATTGNWGGTVLWQDEHHRRETAADMVFVKWDNGNRYCVPIDEIERREQASEQGSP